jgi:hypothetical protein
MGHRRLAVTRWQVRHSGLSLTNPGKGVLCQVSSTFLSLSPSLFSQPYSLLSARFGYTPEVSLPHRRTLSDSHHFFSRRVSNLTKRALRIKRWLFVCPYLPDSFCIQSILHNGHDVVSKGAKNTTKWYTGIHHHSCPSRFVKDQVTKRKRTTTSMTGGLSENSNNLF